MSDELVVQRSGNIATVVFNRPDVRNAFNLAMWSALPGVMEDLNRDPGVRAIVLRGAGEEAFASGADISEFKEHRKDRATAEAYNARTEAAYHALEASPKPTVAMIYGFCMGGGIAIALGCDLRFAAETGKYILFSARTFDATEACTMGFVDQVLPTTDLASFTYDYLARVADNAPLSV